MSHPTPPSLTFAQWCERQGIKEAGACCEGSDTWWADRLDETDWPGVWKGPDARLTACDIARVVLRLPDQSGRKPLPGCKHPWDSIRVWGNGWQAESFKAGCGNHDSTHGEARAVLRFYGEPDFAPGVVHPRRDKWLAATTGQEIVDLYAQRQDYEGACRVRDLMAAVMPKPAPKTDIELLAELRAELGEGWDKETTCHPDTPNSYCFRLKQSWVADVTAAALRKHGPRAVADALRLLAGSDQ